MSNPLFETFSIESPWIINEEKRFDANFYAKDSVASKVLIGELEDRGIEIKNLGAFSKNIFFPGRFKRTLVPKNHGNPFLTPKEVFMFFPEAKKFIIDYSNELDIKENWILITRSGTIGRCIISTKLLNKFVLSDDLIRIIPKKSWGYIYAYLNTWIGKTFLTKDQYGSTVKHIEPQHVENIPIPIIPDLEKNINQTIKKVQNLREDAQNLISMAENVFYSELKLKKIDEDIIRYYGTENGKLINCFIIKSSELNMRLDAPYYEPVVQKIKQDLFESDIKIEKLSNLVKDIFIPPRFKRPYVKDTDEGTLFLSGTDLIEFTPLNAKYLWNKFNKIENYKVHEGYILISARGTVGRPYYVTNIMNGSTASDNIIRCITKPEKILPSYLTAYLLTTHASHQIQALKAGSVQDLLQPIHINDIYVPVPSMESQRKIGNLILEAYTKKDQANNIEEEAIKCFEETLLKLSKTK
jgi:type I restriction enzyme S subunit